MVLSTCMFSAQFQHVEPHIKQWLRKTSELRSHGSVDRDPCRSLSIQSHHVMSSNHCYFDTIQQFSSQRRILQEVKKHEKDRVLIEIDMAEFPYTVVYQDAALPSRVNTTSGLSNQTRASGSGQAPSETSLIILQVIQSPTYNYWDEHEILLKWNGFAPSKQQTFLLGFHQLKEFCIYNTIQYNTIQYNTIQYNTIQYNTIQYNTIQYNVIWNWSPRKLDCYNASFFEYCQFLRSYCAVIEIQVLLVISMIETCIT